MRKTKKQAVLEVVQRAAQKLTTKRIAESAVVPVRTARKYLNEFTEKGYIEKTAQAQHLGNLWSRVPPERAGKRYVRGVYEGMYLEAAQSSEKELLEMQGYSAAIKVQ